NHETCELLGPHYKGKCEMMIDVGVDTEQFYSSSSRPHQDKGVRFLTAGRLEARKGFRLLVDAFALFVAKQPGARLRIVGEGPERRRLERQIKACGLADAVLLTGAVGHDEMRREFESADVFVFPSLRDTSGAVLLEAMAMGLPVICIDHQGAAIMVSDDCGIKIRPGSYTNTVEAMRDALVRLAKDPDERKQLGESARRRAVEDFSWDEKIERMVRIYEKVGCG
ncbi:MAG: glycosyltransferase family 4 protein, partial [Luteolibacter sp.]